MSKRSKFIISACVVGAVILVIVLVVVLHTKKELCPEINDEICLTPGCIQAAATVFKYMDPGVNPCDDFYKFACGNFLKVKNVPDDEQSISSFTLINDNLQQQLKSMIEEPIQKNEPKPFQLIKKMYKACMNTTSIEEKSLKTAQAIVKEAGGWPILDGQSWNSKNFSWITATYKLRKVRIFDSFLKLEIVLDIYNNSRRMLSIVEPDLNLVKSLNFTSKSVDRYYRLMVDMAVLFGADSRVAEKELRESLTFEMQLANISFSAEEREDAIATYNPMTIDELQDKYSSIPWLQYINTFLAPHNTVTKDEVVIVENPNYLSEFEVLIQRTDKRVQANYMMWKVILKILPYMSEEFRKRAFQYVSILHGEKESKPRWKECIAACAQEMKTAVGALYVRKYFNKKAKQEAEEMVENIRSEFVDILKHIDWIDEKTRHNALDKAAAIRLEVAYPDEMLNDQKLEEYYDGLEFNENNYLQLGLNHSLFGMKSLITRLKQPASKNEWTKNTPAVVNAFYSQQYNSIQIPAGILQGVAFDADRPTYMNYGAIGSMIGHEITHGFDDSGRQFDKDGNLVNWWDPKTKEAFLEKAQCIVCQYGNYTVPEIDLNLNGELTKDENIADNGGIKEAYLAYNKWSKRHGTEKLLPGLKYTQNQMFWIAAANFWCSKYRPKSLRVDVLTDEHPPGHFRVVGMFSNSEDFSRDFNCPLGSKMNPKNKCKLW